MSRPETDTRPEPVLLVHGIWMTGFELRLLGARIARCGFRPAYFRYPSLRASPADNAAALAVAIREMGAPRLHLVAHSLGGIVLLHLLVRYRDLPPGRVVLLGSPVAGSGVAGVIARRRWLRPLLGRSLEQGLLGGVPAWPGGREIGIVAGTRSLGVGTFLGGLRGANDGTVSLDETRLAGAADACSVHTSHTGMLASPEVARQVCRFLARGGFDHP